MIRLFGVNKTDIYKNEIAITQFERRKRHMEVLKTLQNMFMNL